MGTYLKPRPQQDNKAKKENMPEFGNEMDIPMSLRDQLMNIPHMNIEASVAKLLNNEGGDLSLVEEFSKSIKEALGSANAVFVDAEVEFAAIKDLIESEIPTSNISIDGSEIATPNFALNTLNGENAKESAREIHRSVLGEENDDQLAATTLREAFFNDVDHHQLQEILFVKDYSKLSIDLREMIHWLIRKGIKVIVAKRRGEEIPDDYGINLSGDFIDSMYLLTIEKKPARLRLSDKKMVA